MVGIILATHGGFRNGILQSGSMIFGDQPMWRLLHYSRAKDRRTSERRWKKPSLLLTIRTRFDLGRSYGAEHHSIRPTACIDGHEDKWTIVAGLKFPMLIDAYGSTHDDGDGSRDCSPDRRKR